MLNDATTSDGTRQSVGSPQWATGHLSASLDISGHLWPNKISTGKDSAREQLGGQKNYSKVKSFVTILLSQAVANEVLGDSLLHVDSHGGSNVLDIENIPSKSQNVKV